MSPDTRHDYAADPSLLGRAFDLLETAFTGLPAHAKAVTKLTGQRWDAASTPFVIEEDGKCIAHVGVLSIDMVIAGRRQTVGGIHAVCTHPDHRHHGHFRRAMTDALTWCDQRFQTLMLFTSTPSLYTRFGFRDVQEHSFHSSAQAASGADRFRAMDLSVPADLAILDHLLTHRDPVSRRLGIGQERAVFTFHCLGKRFLHLPSLDVIISGGVEEQTLHLDDVVATQMPTLADLLACFAGPITRVEYGFTPDLLDRGALATPLPRNLMVRGPFAAEGTQFMVPLSAHC